MAGKENRTSSIGPLSILDENLPIREGDNLLGLSDQRLAIGGGQEREATGSKA